MDNQNGSTPLRNARQEEYCTLRAHGLSQMQAWLDSTPDGQPLVGEPTARNSGSRCERYPHVATRILFLQKEATKQREVHALESKTPLEWMQEIAAIFRKTSNAYSHLSLQKKSKLKAFYAAHLVRMQKLEEANMPVRNTSTDTVPMWKQLAACKCP